MHPQSRGKDAFQKHLEIVVPANFGGENGVLQVPPRKCLVVDYVSGEAFMPRGQKALFGIITTAGGVQVRHYLGANAAGAFGGQDYFWVSGPTHIYADPGTSPGNKCQFKRPREPGVLHPSVESAVDSVRSKRAMSG